MALKNLVAQKATMTEEAIEGIVSDYVRYDTDEKEIAFTPDFAALANKGKVLTYLVAIQGWPFVSEEAIATSAKPADIGEMLGIPGGTLRPILKDLKDGHLVAVKNGAYSVRASNLAAIESAIGSPSGGTGTRKKSRSRKTSKKKNRTTSQSDTRPQDQQSGSGKRKNAGLKDKIDKWITDGWFDSGKTTADVKDRFHDEAIIVAVTSIPGYLINAVRDEALTRKKEEVGGKKVWVYRTRT